MLFVNYHKLKERFTTKFDLSPLTIVNYISQLRKFDGIDISNIQEVEDELYGEYRLTNYKNMIISLLKYLRLNQENNENIIEKYEDYLIDIEEQLINARDLIHEKTEKELEKWITLEQLHLVLKEYEDKIDKYEILDSKYNELKKYDKTLLTDFIVLALYTLLPPRRTKDYSLMHVVSENNYDNQDIRVNYIVTKNNIPDRFVFNQYKTSKKYGQQIIEINNNKLILILKKYFLTRDYDGTDMIFLLNTNGVKNLTNNYKKRLTSNSMSIKIKNIFKKSYLKKKVNLNILRHVFISETIGIEEINRNNIRKRLAFEMGHSVSTQLNYIKY